MELLRLKKGLSGNADDLNNADIGREVDNTNQRKGGLSFQILEKINYDIKSTLASFALQNNNVTLIGRPSNTTNEYSKPKIFMKDNLFEEEEKGLFEA